MIKTVKRMHGEVSSSSSSLFEIRPQGSIKQYTVNIKNRHRKKRKHTTIKLEATGKHTNTRKHTKVKTTAEFHSNIVLYYFEPLTAAHELIQKHYA